MLRRVKWNVSRRASARRDVDGVEAPKFAREVVVAADQKELVRIGVLGAEPVLAGYDAPPERDAAKGDRTPLAQRRQLLIPTSVVLPNARVAPEEILGKLPGPEGVDAAFMAMDRCPLAVCGTPRLEALLSRPAHVVPCKGLEPMLVLVASDVPEPPPDDRFGVDLAHATIRP